MTAPCQADVNALIAQLSVIRSQRRKAVVFVHADLMALILDNARASVKCSPREAWIYGYPVVLDATGKTTCWSISTQPKRAGKAIE